MENSAKTGNPGTCRKESCKAEESIGGFGLVSTAPASPRAVQTLMRDPSQPNEVRTGGRSKLPSLDDLSVLLSFWAKKHVSTCTAPPPPQQPAFSALAYLRKQKQILCSNIPQLLRCGNLAFLRSKSHDSPCLLLY